MGKNKGYCIPSIFVVALMLHYQLNVDAVKPKHIAIAGAAASAVAFVQAAGKPPTQPTTPTKAATLTKPPPTPTKQATRPIKSMTRTTGDAGDGDGDGDDGADGDSPFTLGTGDDSSAMTATATSSGSSPSTTVAVGNPLKVTEISGSEEPPPQSLKPTDTSNSTVQILVTGNLNFKEWQTPPSAVQVTIKPATNTTNPNFTASQVTNAKVQLQTSFELKKLDEMTTTATSSGSSPLTENIRMEFKIAGILYAYLNCKVTFFTQFGNWCIVDIGSLEVFPSQQPHTSDANHTVSPPWMFRHIAQVFNSRPAGHQRFGGGGGAGMENVDK